MGGSDQWGNITTGTELIRRKNGGESFAVTIPLVTKSDGTKFGKTEKGNVWLSPDFTSPYAFYQFWINTSDEDAEKYIKVFTLLTKPEIDALITEHKADAGRRILQMRLAQEITTMVHGTDAYNTAVEASKILFGKSTREILSKLDENTFLSVFEGVGRYPVAINQLQQGIPVIDLLSDITNIFPSKSECRRLMKDNGLSINLDKYSDQAGTVDTSYLLNNKYILVRKGKKDYFIIVVA